MTDLCYARQTNTGLEIVIMKDGVLTVSSPLPAGQLFNLLSAVSQACAKTYVQDRCKCD